jgi:chemotaxis signal transduction protein
MKTEVDGVSAWLLSISQAENVAVGEFEFIHIVDQPEYFSVPQAPEFCKQVILWNENIVPVMNLSSWFSGQKQDETNAIVAILIYKNLEDELSYGGLKLVKIPALIQVNNDLGCLLPDKLDKWKEISLSSFKSENEDVIPILDVATLFLQEAKY